MFKILFVGNSHTYFNDMPKLAGDMIQDITGTAVSTVMIASSNASLKWHMQDYYSIRYQLLFGNFTAVVIQERMDPAPPEEETTYYANRIINLCHTAYASPFLLLPQDHQENPYRLMKMQKTLEKVAGDKEAEVIPVGLVWDDVYRKHPEIDLYFADHEHASEYGTFLTAAVIAETLTGRELPVQKAESRTFLDGNSDMLCSEPHVAEVRWGTKTQLKPESAKNILEAAARIVPEERERVSFWQGKTL
jgi:hypothetical protein